jgi:hypothetical protein
MSADKLRKASSSGVANVATVTAPRIVGGTSLSVGAGALLNWTTQTSTDFITYKLTNGVVSEKATWTGKS